MTLKNICTSLELSKKLAEARVPQADGIAYWIENGITDKWEFIENYEGTIPRARAFVFNELWEMLPLKISSGIGYEYLLEIERLTIDDINYIEFTYEHKCEAAMAGVLKNCSGIPQEAAGELLLWCIEQGYVNLKEDEDAR